MTNISLSNFNGNSPSMSSRELADLTQTRHDNVKRTIEALAHKKAITLPQFEETCFLDTLGKRQTVTECHLNQRDTMVVAARLNPQFMARVVDRWMELEGKLANAVPAQVAQLVARVAVLEQDRFNANPQWVALARYRGMGLSYLEIGKLTGWSDSTQGRLVRAAREAGLGHLMPATATAPVGRKLPAVDAAQMSLGM